MKTKTHCGLAAAIVNFKDFLYMFIELNIGDENVTRARVECFSINRIFNKYATSLRSYYLKSISE